MPTTRRRPLRVEDFFTTPASAYLPYAATLIPIPTHASQGFAPLMYTPRQPAYSDFGRQTEARAEKLAQPPLARPYSPPHVQWAPDVGPEPPLYDQHRRPHPQYEPSGTHRAQFAPDQFLPAHDPVPPRILRTKMDNSPYLGNDARRIANSTRGLFQMLAAVGSFGAGLSFSTFYTAETAENNAALAFLAWAYASFLTCTITTFIWQIVLVSGLTSVRGRLYRSRYGIFFALVLSFVCATAGAIFLSLAFTKHRLLSVRVAGYTVIGAIGILGSTSLLRLYTTVLRRTRSSARPFYENGSDAATKISAPDNFAGSRAEIPLRDTHDGPPNQTPGLHSSSGLPDMSPTSAEPGSPQFTAEDQPIADFLAMWTRSGFPEALHEVLDIPDSESWDISTQRERFFAAQNALCSDGDKLDPQIKEHRHDAREFIAAGQKYRKPLLRLMQHTVFYEDTLVGQVERLKNLYKVHAPLPQPLSPVTYTALEDDEAIATEFEQHYQYGWALKRLKEQRPDFQLLPQEDQADRIVALVEAYSAHPLTKVSSTDSHTSHFDNVITYLNLSDTMRDMLERLASDSWFLSLPYRDNQFRVYRLLHAAYLKPYLPPLGPDGLRDVEVRESFHDINRFAGDNLDIASYLTAEHNCMPADRHASRDLQLLRSTVPNFDDMSLTEQTMRFERCREAFSALLWSTPIPHTPSHAEMRHFERLKMLEEKWRPIVVHLLPFPRSDTLDMQVTRVRLLYEALTPDGIPPPWPEPVIPALYFGPEVGTSTAPPAPVMGVIPLSERLSLPHSYSDYPLPTQQQYPDEYSGDESYEPGRGSDNDADSMYTASQGEDPAET